MVMPKTKCDQLASPAAGNLLLYYSIITFSSVSYADITAWMTGDITGGPMTLAYIHARSDYARLDQISDQTYKSVFT